MVIRVEYPLSLPQLCLVVAGGETVDIGVPDVRLTRAAVLGGDLDVLDFLVATCGADPHVKLPLAAHVGFDPDFAFEKPLHILAGAAAAAVEPAVLNLFLDHPRVIVHDWNSGQANAGHVAVSCGRAGVVMHLLEHARPTDGATLDWRCPDAADRNLLQLAFATVGAEPGEVDLVERLFRYALAVEDGDLEAVVAAGSDADHSGASGGGVGVDPGGRPPSGLLALISASPNGSSGSSRTVRRRNAHLLSPSAGGGAVAGATAGPRTLPAAGDPKNFMSVLHLAAARSRVDLIDLVAAAADSRDTRCAVLELRDGRCAPCGDSRCVVGCDMGRSGIDCWRLPVCHYS